MSTRSYGQYCAIARALDHVGDRWTLLIVRELLRGPRTFRSLQRSLPGVHSSLLSQRLASMASDGLVERGGGPRRSKSVSYSLTDAGSDLEALLLAFVRWGGRYVISGPGDDFYDPAWFGIVLKALLDGTEVGEPIERVALLAHVSVSGDVNTIRAGEGRRSVSYGPVGEPDVEVVGDLMEVLAVIAGFVDLDSTNLAVSGDRSVARAVLRL